MERRIKGRIHAEQRPFLGLPAHTRNRRRIAKTPLSHGSDVGCLLQTHDAAFGLRHDVRDADAALLGDCDVPLGHQPRARCCFAMLDPVVLKRMMETWMTVDVHQHFGTEFLTGVGIGPWYSVNDYAMSRMAKEYLRWTGDKAWLDKTVGGKTVFEHLLSITPSTGAIWIRTSTGLPITAASIICSRPFRAMFTRSPA